MKTTLDDLRQMLICAEVRLYDSDFVVRMGARKDVDDLKKRIARAERAARKLTTKAT